MALLDLTQTVLILEAHNQAAISSFGDPHNEKFLICQDLDATIIASNHDDREKTPCVEPPSHHCTLQLNQRDLQDPSRGWTFGSDPRICDFLLGKQSIGVSKIHFRIWHNWNSRTLVLTNESKTAGNTKLEDDSGEMEELPPSASRVISPGHQLMLVAGIVKLGLRIPSRGNLEGQYQLNLTAFGKEIGLRPPALGALQIRVPSAATRKVAVGHHGYILGDVVGRGSFGTVFTAWDHETGEQFAIKRFSGIRGKIDVDMVKNEIELMKKIRHDLIIKFVDSNTFENAVPMLVMEYASFGPLSEKLGLGEDEIGNIFTQMLHALVYLHEVNQVTHRDIKPDNILITSRRPIRAKLSDFGLSKQGQLLNTGCGSPLYLAPEVASNAIAQNQTARGAPVKVPQISYTQKIDIWSLGVVLLEHTVGLPTPEMQQIGEYQDWVNRLIERATSERGKLIEKAAMMLRRSDTARPTARDLLRMMREDKVSILEARGRYTATVRTQAEDLERGRSALQQEVSRLMTMPRPSAGSANAPPENKRLRLGRRRRQTRREPAALQEEGRAGTQNTLPKTLR